MLKQLAMLFKLRSWLKSDTLKTGGLVGILAVAQTYLSSQDGLDLLNMIAGFLGLTGSTLSGIVLGIISVAILVQRALTEHSLAKKIAPPAEIPVPASATNQSP